MLSIIRILNISRTQSFWLQKVFVLTVNYNMHIYIGMSWFQKSHWSIYTKRVHKVTNRVLPYFHVVVYKRKTINK